MGENVHSLLYRLRFDSKLKNMGEPTNFAEALQEKYHQGCWPPIWVRCNAQEKTKVDTILIAPKMADEYRDQAHIYLNPILLDTTSTPWSINIVLREWSEHIIDFNMLDNWTPEPKSKTDWRRWDSEFERLGKSDKNGRKRWNYGRDGAIIYIDTRGFGEVEQRVGRLSFSADAWPFDLIKSRDKLALNGRIDVILVPRLVADTPVPKEHRGARIIFAPETADSDRKIIYKRSPLAPISTKRFLAMLSLAAGFDVDWRSGTTFSPVDAEFSALVLEPLVSGLEQAARAIRQEYLRERQVRRAPAGTIRLGAYASQIARGRPDRVPVYRYERSVDHLENQFYVGICQHLRRTLAADPGRRAAQLHQRLDTVETLLGRAMPIRPTVPIADRLLRNPMIGPARRNTIKLARLSLLNRFPGLSPDGAERASAQEIEVSIAALFEESVRAILADALCWEFIHPDDIMDTPGCAHQMRWVGNTSGRPKLKPDIFARRGSEIAVVGDVKYKRCRKDPSSTFSPMTREDFHQLCTYAHAWPEAKKLVMVYVDTDESEDKKPATRLHATLQMPHRRQLNIYSFAPERWYQINAGEEALIQYLRKI